MNKWSRPSKKILNLITYWSSWRIYITHSYSSKRGFAVYNDTLPVHMKINMYVSHSFYLQINNISTAYFTCPFLVWFDSTVYLHSRHRVVYSLVIVTWCMWWVIIVDVVCRSCASEQIFEWICRVTWHHIKNRDKHIEKPYIHNTPLQTKYLYRQSQYPKSSIGKCHIPVDQWLEPSACNRVEESIHCSVTSKYVALLQVCTGPK